MLPAANRDGPRTGPAEGSGQTMHFFSEAYLRKLPAGWQQVQLVPVAVPDRRTGEPFKQVWRGIARR